MAAFDFPNSPSNGDTYSANGIDWIYNGNVWKKDATAGVKGQKGEVGQKGQKGEVGEKGVKGEVGPKGQKGEIGATGGTGGTGTKGQKGDKGQKGEDNSTKGQKGELGNTGGTGGTGSQGDKGQKGEIGVTGTVFTSGTRMLFQQTTAPTGWTKDSSRNNRALRIVNGSVTDGGGNGFVDVLNSTVTTSGGIVQNHTLTESQIPSHYHYAFRSGNAGQLRNGSNLSSNNYPGSGTGPGNLYETYNITARNEVPNVGRTSNAGSTQGHNHGFTNPSFNLNVLYTDVIIAQKN